MARRKTPVIIVVSDGRGETGAQLVEAAAVQFEGSRYRVVREGNVRDPEQIERIVETAAKKNAAIFYTLVSEDTRRCIRRECRARHVPTVDVLGPAFTALHDLFKSERGATPGLLYAREHDRFDRMEAIDYTLKHDDGLRVQELSKADVVLVGVSRASKSSTCFFLAYEGIRAANVPLIPELPLPRQLLALPSEKVVGLRVNVNRLMTIREARARSMKLKPSDAYLDRRTLMQEVVAADRLMQEHGWRSLDVSYLAVEEIAREVMRLRGVTGSRPW